MKTRVTWSARCLDGCGWTATGDIVVVDREARRHTGEGAFGKKPGPHHPTVLEGLAA